MFRLAALDLDDTLLDAQGALSPASAAALHGCIRAGVEIVVASGRPYAALPQEIRTFPGIRWAITSNGAAITEIATGKTAVRFCLSAEAADAILAAFPAEELECAIGGQPYCSSAYLAQQTDGRRAAYLQRTRKGVDSVPALIRQQRGSLDAINIYVRSEAHRLACLAAARQIPGIYVTSSCAHLVEMADRQAGKGPALRWLCARLGIPLADTAAFGNGDNDADLLRTAGRGFAVANATPACRAAAGRICGANDEDGVAAVLRELLSE